MDWLPDFFNKFVAVSNVAGNIASVLGFITILATVIGYLITHAVRDPYGDKYPRKPRYYRFFVSLAGRVRKRDKTLIPPSVIGGANSAVFTTAAKVAGIDYHVHFPDDGTFRVFVNFTGGQAKARFEALQSHKDELKKRLGLTKRFGRRPANDVLKWEHEDGRADYRFAIYYPGLVTIEDDGKKLKQVRKWALKRLVALKNAVDELAPEAAVKQTQLQPVAS